MSKEERKNIIINLILIQKLFGYGTATAGKVFEKLKEEDLLCTDFESIRNSKIFSDKIEAKFKTADVTFAHSVIKDCSENGINILNICDSLYPERLRNIDNPPLILYIKGEFPKIDDEPILCIVGPRKVTAFGEKAAYSLSMRFAKAGFLIVSGAAKGADSFAHLGALNHGCKTVGVLGCGILSNYLAENKKLRERISENGCLISEYPPRTDASKYTFPVRNRIMSALSLGVIVVEAGEKSGALTTARHAADQGREVFVIPGNPTLSEYKGSNALLREGALPLIDASDVFNVYIPNYAEKIDLKKAFEETPKPQKDKKIIKKSTETLSKEAKILYNSLNKLKFTADDLPTDSLSEDDILSSLTELEVEGFIKAEAGGFYRLIQ